MAMTTGAKAGAGRFPVLVSVGVALLPKCPLCFGAHAAVLAAAGVGTAWTLPALAASLALVLLLLARGARGRRGYAPFALGCAATVLLVAASIRHHPGAHTSHAHHPAEREATTPLFAAGAMLLLAASVWNAWPKSRRGQACTSSMACGS